MQAVLILIVFALRLSVGAFAEYHYMSNKYIIKNTAWFCFKFLLYSLKLIWEWNSMTSIHQMLQNIQGW